jgi:hypothetical protein
MQCMRNMENKTESNGIIDGVHNTIANVDRERTKGMVFFTETIRCGKSGSHQARIVGRV